MSESTKFDKRLVERNLRKGIITQKELEEHVKGLEDKATRAARVESVLESVYKDKDDQDGE